MKTRILSNGAHYRVQVKQWFWPFWITASTVNEGGGTSYFQFDTKPQAEEFIKNTKLKESPWRVVND